MGIVHIIQKFCSHKERCMYKELNGPIVMKCERCDKVISCDTRAIERRAIEAAEKKEVARKYVKRGTVEADQLTGASSIARIFGETIVISAEYESTCDGKSSFTIETVERVYTGQIGDYITKDAFGNFAVVPKKEFEQTYSEVE